MSVRRPCKDANARGIASRAIPLLMCCASALATSGCSLSFPIAGFVPDAMPTGSIDSGTSLLSKELDQEDWRRAKSAMAVALDPQGNGASVDWANPQSGAKGTFVAVAAPYPKSDRICRAFLAHTTPDPRQDREVAGSACRGSDGEWVVADAREVRKTRS